MAGFTVIAEASGTVQEKETAPTPAPMPQSAEPSPEPAPAKVKLNRIFGFSACAVTKALGKAGVKYAEANRIFHAHGIEMPKASLSIQLGFGRNPTSWEHHGKPAELTDAQVAELRAEVAKPSA
jgi:hypothetical protein